mgnify:CR=1 FL=1
MLRNFVLEARTTSMPTDQYDILYVNDDAIAFECGFGTKTFVIKQTVSPHSSISGVESKQENEIKTDVQMKTDESAFTTSTTNISNDITNSNNTNIYHLNTNINSFLF